MIIKFNKKDDKTLLISGWTDGQLMAFINLLTQPRKIAERMTSLKDLPTLNDPVVRNALGLRSNLAIDKEIQGWEQMATMCEAIKGVITDEELNTGIISPGKEISILKVEPKIKKNG